MDVRIQDRSRSLAAVKTAGLALGVVLAAALLAILVVEHAVHLGDDTPGNEVPWWLLLGWGLAFYAIYWLGFRYLLGALQRHGAHNEALIDALQAAEHQFRALFDRNPLPMWVYDAETLSFLEVNAAAERQYGYSRDEFLRMSILDIRPEEQRAEVVAFTRQLVPGTTHKAREWTHRRKDGSLIDVRIHSRDMRFQGRQAWLILAEDITEELARQREIAWRATHDPTTGLLDARAFADVLQGDEGTGWHIAYVQSRGLELIEDSLGVEVATRIVQRMARRLERLGAQYGAIGQARPEAFVLGVRDPARWNEALETLREELARPVTGSDSRQQLESWIGTATFPGDHPDAMEALRLAAIAAHIARAEGHAWAAYTPAMSRQAGRRLRVAARLHRALENEEFQLHFQPIRNLATGSTAGLEALLRWPQAEGASIPPNDFIGVAEDTGLIVPLGRWVLREAAHALRRLQDAGHGGLAIAINVSQAQFHKSDLLADVDAILREFAPPRGALHLELTESILMTRPEHARATLHALRERGLCVSLDDFGTGFSSMAYLRHLPIDALKIDRAFVRDVHQDRRNASICQALLSLGHSLELKVVAEGVESQAEYDWLRQHRCDQAQGYCIARPAPLEELLPTL